MTNKTNFVHLGARLGVAYFLALAASFLSMIPTGMYPENVPWQVVGVLVTCVSSLLYAVLVLGMIQIAKEKNLPQFATRLWMFIWLCAVMIVAMLPLSFPALMTPALGVVTSLVMLVSLFVVGVVSIKIAKDFLSIQSEFGELATKAAKWSKVSGWLVVTIVLSPIGVIFAILADYYIWRMLQVRTKKEIPSQ